MFPERSVEESGGKSVDLIVFLAVCAALIVLLQLNAVFLGEKVTGLEILGGAAILVGVAIATLAPGGVCNKANGVRSEI